jgi:hypothetical protein
MSSRASFRFAVPFFAAVLVAGGAGFAITACSSSTLLPDNTNTAEAGIDAGGDSGRIKVEAGPEQDSAMPTQTTQECIDACNAAHPKSVAKETAIDTCWSANCKGPCLDNPPTGYDAGGGSDAGADAADVCGSGVATSEPTCNDCTQQYCCTSWNGCFMDTDCSALDDCIGKCP